MCDCLAVLSLVHEAVKRTQARVCTMHQQTTTTHCSLGCIWTDVALPSNTRAVPRQATDFVSSLAASSLPSSTLLIALFLRSSPRRALARVLEGCFLFWLPVFYFREKLQSQSEGISEALDFLKKRRLDNVL